MLTRFGTTSSKLCVAATTSTFPLSAFSTTTGISRTTIPSITTQARLLFSASSPAAAPAAASSSSATADQEESDTFTTTAKVAKKAPVAAPTPPLDPPATESSSSTQQQQQQHHKMYGAPPLFRASATSAMGTMAATVHEWHADPKIRDGPLQFMSTCLLFFLMASCCLEGYQRVRQAQLEADPTTAGLNTTLMWGWLSESRTTHTPVGI